MKQKGISVAVVVVFLGKVFWRTPLTAWQANAEVSGVFHRPRQRGITNKACAWSSYRFMSTTAELPSAYRPGASDGAGMHGRRWRMGLTDTQDGCRDAMRAVSAQKVRKKVQRRCRCSGAIIDTFRVGVMISGARTLLCFTWSVFPGTKVDFSGGLWD